MTNKIRGGGKFLVAKFGRTDEAKKVRKENMKQGRDYSPFQAKQISFEENETMNTITCATQKDNLVIQVKSATKEGYEEAREGDSVNYSVPNSATTSGRVGHQQAQTIDTAVNQAVFLTGQIRRLTEIECERLQGFPDNHTMYGNYDGEIKKISKTQRYKMCGNAVTVDVVQMIGKKLFNTLQKNIVNE